MAPTYHIETYGCQMNFHDAERMAGLLEAAGYEPAADPADADVVVINTCSVREHAEDKLYTRLGEIRAAAEQSGNRPVVAVAGCVAQQEREKLLARAPFIDVVVGTQAIRQLPALVARAAADAAAEALVDVNPYEDVSFPLGLARRGDPVRAFVTIIEGCNDHCAFCVVPHTRGKERMRPLEAVLDEIRQVAATGRKEVQLLGQIVNHYQAPDAPGCDFARLLEHVQEIGGIERIRFASPHPRHFNRRLVEAVRDLSKVCKHVHLPVQSGSNRILTAMRRRHTREWYLNLVATLRREVPGIAVSTDMIVGFPGETLEDFEETLSLVREVRFHSMFSFKYSPRPNTLALKRMPDDVPEVEKTRRIVALQQLQREQQLCWHEAAVGKTFTVLVDNLSRRRETEVSGRTSGNTVVNLPGSADLIGQFVAVRVERAGPYSLWGQRVAPALDTAPREAYV